MKKLLILSAFAAFAASPAAAQYQQNNGFTGLSGSNPNNHRVSPYTTNSGTYVQPHTQTNPNNTQRDNYGSVGNVNPNNGQYGTRQPRF